MKIKYKQVKIPMPHCSDCGDMLLGNGSIIIPYYCSCGTWRVKLDENYKPDGFELTESK